MKPITLAISLGTCLGFSLSICSFSHAENWSQWRGNDLDNVSEETNLPTKWSAEENVLWRTPLPGPAGASPVVWEDQIFLTSVDGQDLLLICIGTDGKKQWQQIVGKGNKDVRGDEGNSASPSPCTDGEAVYCLMGSGDMAAYSLAGKEIWKADMQERYGKFKIAFGMTATPVLHEDNIYVQLIHGEGNPETREATIVALNKKTGETVWKTGRPSDARAECEHSYASPTIYDDGETAYLLTHGADYVVAQDLKTGEEIWRCGELNPKTNYNPTLRFVASPVAAEGRIVVPSAKNGPVFCIKPDAKGDITDKEDAFFWKRDRGTPDVPTPVIKDGLVYLCRESGNLICVDAETGEEYYEARTEKDRHRGSPINADGHIYLTARNGVVSVIKAGKEFEMVSQNDIGEDLSASPAISNGRIYLRSFDALWAIGDK
jgi:outer membrane protein assembly factor BamB